MTAFIPKGKPRSIFDIHAKEKQVLFSERLDYLEGQAKAGNASAQFSLGLFYHRGFGPCAPSEKTASKWYLLAAQQGFVRAQYIVGMAYLKGSKGFPKSEKLAAYWLHLAAEGGIASAQWMLGVGYEMGAGGLPRSPEQAMHWFSLAAKQGHEKAQRRVAELQKASEKLSPPVVEASAIATEV